MRTNYSYAVITVFAHVLFIALTPLCIFHELPEGIFSHACSKLHTLMPADIVHRKKGGLQLFDHKTRRFKKKAQSPFYFNHKTVMKRNIACVSVV